MTKIHGAVYIAIGAFVAIVSLLKSDKLFIFLYAGIAFIVIGVSKLILNFLKKGGKTTKVHQSHPTQVHHARYCSQCGNTLKPNDRFCSICGARV